MEDRDPDVGHVVVSCRKSQVDRATPNPAPVIWAATKAGAEEGAIPAKAVAQGPRDRHGRVGEGGRGREPIGRRDVEPDDGRNRGGPESERPEDRSHQSEGRDGFRQSLSGPVAQPGRDLQHGFPEHQVRRADPEDGSDQLRGHVGRRHPGIEIAPQGKDQCHGGIEMRAGERPEDRDEHDEPCTGRDRIAEKRDGAVPARQALAHDAGADHDREEQHRAQHLRDEAARQVDPAGSARFG